MNCFKRRAIILFACAVLVQNFFCDAAISPSVPEKSLSALELLSQKLSSLQRSFASLKNALSKLGGESKRIISWNPRDQFVQDVIGISEDEFKNNLEDKISEVIKYDEIKDEYFIINQEDKKKNFWAGSFTKETINALHAGISHYDKMHGGKPGGGSFVVKEALPSYKDAPHANSYYDLFNTSALQADPAYRDAVFQVASNFNALETLPFFEGASDFGPQGITKYVSDPTQGPAASISAAPGTLYRHYAIFHVPFFDDPITPDNGQKADKQINLLDRLNPKEFPVDKRGYVNWTQLEELKPDTENPSNYDDVKVAYHENIQVTHGARKGSNHAFFYDPDQLISQVFTAAVDLNTNSKFRKNPIALERARNILHAAYKGTIYAAYMRGKKKVVLTLVGCGVFGNKIEWIGEVLLELAGFIKESGMQVELPIYSMSSQTEDERKAFREQIKEIINKVGRGSYTQYSNAKPDGELIHSAGT